MHLHLWYRRPNDTVNIFNNFGGWFVFEHHLLFSICLVVFICLFEAWPCYVALTCIQFAIWTLGWPSKLKSVSISQVPGLQAFGTASSLIHMLCHDLLMNKETCSTRLPFYSKGDILEHQITVLLQKYTFFFFSKTSHLAPPDISNKPREIK